MIRSYILIVLFLLPLSLLAQRLEEFSTERAEFIAQLQDYMTEGKQKSMEEAYKEFEDRFKGGMFSEEEEAIIQQTGNAMLQERMSANPYFRTYLETVLRIKQYDAGGEKFKEWHRVLDAMLASGESFRSSDFQDFLKFSRYFFEEKALRYSATGTSWHALTDNFRFNFAEGEPVVEFEQLDLLASRKQDSIFIHETSGVFFPVEQYWRGNGGRVTWERFGWEDEVYVELSAYEFEMRKSLYSAEGARLHYPLFFGTKAVEGSFSDKLVVSNAATDGSYPRFESDDKVLNINNIGEGIDYTGGFRMYGTTVYGYGSKDNRAKIRIKDNKEQLVFRAASELFTIRRQERIVGEKVEAVIYLGADSLYHPSVNIRFEIPKGEVQLSRGDRGSDRNPFYSSIHGVNIDADKIFAYPDRDSMLIGKETISIAKKADIHFESLKFFNGTDYRRFQNIATSNPLAIMKVTAEQQGKNFIDANLLAHRLNAKYTVENIKGLLYDLSAKGFINYDSDNEMVEVKDKVFHYVNAEQDNVDYDVLSIRSTTDSTNAVMDFETKNIEIRGVESIEFSNKQRVGILPKTNRVILKPNRNMDFGGKLYAGFSTLEGNGFHFNYDQFQIDLDSIRYLDFYVPTGEFDRNRNPIARSIGSRLENLSGVLLIDAPNNKSGRENIIMFPSLQVKDTSFVYYDYQETQDSLYGRDSFYFEVNPFSFNHLDALTAKDLRFDGTLKSSKIFPDIKETLRLMDDRSLGFTTELPEGGEPVYEGKGQYGGMVRLSNSGLEGEGNLRYLGASIFAENFVFRPEQMLAGADAFDLEEDRESEIEVPQVHGDSVRIDWRPYKDSMYVQPQETPFELFKEDNHTLDGTLILTPDGLKGDGAFQWDKAVMNSQYFSFGAFSARSDTTTVGIRAFNTQEFAIQTENVNGVVDFDEQSGRFSANNEFLETILPYNQYQTSMNEFDWNMSEETINFKSDEDNLVNFISIHPDQDSLTFDGRTAFYDLKTNELKIGGVPNIISADALIYPDSGKVDIQPGGVMTTLENAQIVADTLNKYHVINRATVDILGRKNYKASGFYQYDIADREQEIEFSNITGQRIGKGAWSEKRVATRAKGEVTELDSFYIDHKTSFQGTISLRSESKNLQFDGFARLEADKLPERNWFTIRSEGDKKDLAIKYDSPKSFDGYPLETGFFLSKETARIYPRVMMALYFRKDRPILPIEGVFTYDQDQDEFIFGDSSRVLGESLRGNRMVFNNRDGGIQGEGSFNLGSGLENVHIDATGRIETEFLQIPANGPDSVLATIPAPPVLADFMAGIKMAIPEKLLRIIVNDIQSASFDAKNMTYLTDLPFFQKATADLFGESDEIKTAIEGISSGFLEIPEKRNPYTFFFSRLNMKWDRDYQSFISTEPRRVGLGAVNGEIINKVLTCYVEFKMPSNEDDRLYIYIKSPSELYYFFGYKQGILNITSNNPRFNEELLGMKKKDLMIKLDTGENFEIQPVEPTTAKRFLRRIQAVNK